MAVRYWIVSRIGSKRKRGFIALPLGSANKYTGKERSRILSTVLIFIPIRGSKDRAPFGLRYSGLWFGWFSLRFSRISFDLESNVVLSPSLSLSLSYCRGNDERMRQIWDDIVKWEERGNRRVRGTKRKTFPGKIICLSQGETWKDTGDTNYFFVKGYLSNDMVLY